MQQLSTESQPSGLNNFRQMLLEGKDDTNKVNSCDSMADMLTFSYPDTSLFYGQLGLKLANKLNFEHGELLSAKDLGFAYIVLGNYSNSINYLLQSIRISQNLNDTFNIVDNYLGLVFCYREQKDYEKSLYYINEARKITRPSDAGLVSLTDDVVSSVYEQTNQLDSALFYANRALPLQKGHSYLMYVLGAINSKSGHFSDAQKYYQQALTLSLKDHVQKDVFDTYDGIAELYRREGKLDSAIYFAKLALIPTFGRTFPIDVFRASNLLADIYEIQHKPDSALKYLRQTIILKDSLYSQQKTRDAQNFTFNEQLHQQELKQKIEENELQYNSRLHIYILLGGLIVLLIVAAGLWRRNVYRQKSFAQLQKQKQEIDTQKTKVERTLDELRVTQSQLIQSEKMASLGELTAGIAHEIQNPLNFVNNFSEVNRELIDEASQAVKTGNSGEAMELLSILKDNEKKINHHGKRADAIVKGMLQHTRVSTGQKEPGNINAIADECLKLSYHAIRAKDKFFEANLETHFDATIDKTPLIQQDIVRVFVNLFNNAFYVVNEKSKQQIQGYEPTVSVTTKKSADRVEIRVRDNGTGIPEKVVDKIFQPFFTTKPTGLGTGLGLSLSYDIIKAHGGEINVNTKEGDYAEFVVQLPISS